VRAFIASVAILELWLGVARAECQTGQTATSQTWPAVFGGTETRAAAPGGLDLSAQLFAAYDDDLLADQTGNAPDRPTLASSADGFYSGLAVTLLYARPGDRANFRSWTNNGLNYYPALKDLTTTYHEVGLAFSTPLGKRFSIDASPFATYMPRFSMRLFPAPLPLDPAAWPPLADGAGTAAPDVDFTLVEHKGIRYGGRAGLSFLATPNSSVNLAYSNIRTTTPSGDQSADVEVQSASVTLSHKVTQYASLRMGYSRVEGKFERADTPVTRTQSLDVGVDYRKPLSRRRRTFLRLNGGSALADADRTAGRRIQAVGFATLVHQMGRTWTAQAQYRREIRFIEGFDRPVFSDVASSSVGGLLTRRVDVAVNASYFTGSVGLSQGAPRFDSFSASARLRRALTRTLGAYVEYLFYRYEFDEAAVRPAGLPPMFNRNGARVGLSVWLPLTD
jgi:hypothetical protein